MDCDGDVLDRIACGEELVYNEAYERSFLQSMHEPFGLSTSTIVESQRLGDLSKPWRLGMIHGMKMASEFSCYYGMCLEILENRHQLDSSTVPTRLHKRLSRLQKAASDLHQLLVCEGLDPIHDSSKFLEHLLKADWDLIRSKARLLNSLLDMNNLEEGMDDLKF